MTRYSGRPIGEHGDCRNKVLTAFIYKFGYNGNARAPEGYERERQNHGRHHAATDSQKDWPSGMTSCIMWTMLLYVSVILDTR